MVMFRTALICAICLLGPRALAAPAFPLVEATEGYQDKYGVDADQSPAPEPPAGVFERVHYPAPLGENVAYVTPVRSGAPGPAMVWIAGGFDWGIGDAWTPQPRDNDQSAAAFREAGIALMLPALRGSNGNPGRNELMLGEVHDVRAAATWLASRPDVDPSRIYLGGHSTGGTMALLVAETTEQFRAVFAFGPVGAVANYGAPYDAMAEKAIVVRAPVVWLESIRTPTWVIEGSGGNAEFLAFFEEYVKGAPVHLVKVKKADHFSVLRAGSEEVARSILGDKGPAADLTIDPARITRTLRAPADPPARSPDAP